MPNQPHWRRHVPGFIALQCGVAFLVVDAAISAHLLGYFSQRLVVWWTGGSPGFSLQRPTDILGESIAGAVFLGAGVFFILLARHERQKVQRAELD